MSYPAPQNELRPTVEAHLLGQVDFNACLALQQRLVYEASGSSRGNVTLLVCEHPLIVTVGRQGSRSHIRLSEHELMSRQIEVRWVNRGGGCLVHAPGQLAVYPIVPLARWSLNVGEYLKRLQAALVAALADMSCAVETRPDRFGLWSHRGQVMAVAAAVKNWVSYYGAYINVSPALFPFRWVESDAVEFTSMTSLAADYHRAVRMSGVREAVVRRLSEAFECERYHVYSGHPLLRPPRGVSHANAARVG